jgi:hypothetical protein
MQLLVCMASALVMLYYYEYLLRSADHAILTEAEISTYKLYICTYPGLNYTLLATIFLLFSAGNLARQRAQAAGVC